MPIPPTAQSASALLTTERLRTLLDEGGYRCTVTVARGANVLPIGCSISLQFGDLVARVADGVLRVTIRCSLVVNGNEGGGGVTRWSIGKTFPVSVCADRFGFVIDADVLLGIGVRLDDLLTQGVYIYHHLRLLIADARRTLCKLPVDDRRDETVRPPVVRIETRLAGDLAAGRSGFVNAAAGGGGPAAALTRRTARDVRMGLAACDLLAGEILPELARATRALIARERAIGAPAPRNGGANSWSLPAPLSGEDARTMSETLQ
jgi:hypothetical protein